MQNAPHPVSARPPRPLTLYVAVSAHGYGHIAQTAPVVNALGRRIPGLRVVVESSAPRPVLERRLDMAFEHVEAATDFGMVMKDALTVDAAASCARYAALHAGLADHVSAARERLEAHAPDLLLANVPYVPLIAAHDLGIPSAVLCSLDWAHIFRGVCGPSAAADAICGAMLDAYRSAQVFLAPEPSMAMPGLANVVAIGTIAETAQSARAAARAKLGVSAAQRLVVVSMGGIDTPLDLGRWPGVPGVTWAFDKPLPDGRRDMVAVTGSGLAFLEVMAAADAVITKPGYGTFAEAACNGVPVLYVPREDWPEAPFLTRWLHARWRCVEARYEQLFGAELAGRLDALWRLPAREPVAPDGAEDAAARLETLFTRSDRAAKRARH